MRLRQTLGWACLLALVGVGGTACGDGFGANDEDNGRLGGPSAAGFGSANGGTSGGFTNGDGDGDGDQGGDQVPALPPEEEIHVDFELPQASERYVYAANPEGGTVSIIDAESLHIQTLETGERPTFLRTLAGTNDAIVLNVGSEDATIIRRPDEGATTSTLSAVRGANAIGVAPDGKHAVVYFNSSFSTAGNASGSYQDVTVLKLDADEGDVATDMTVGFRPRDVFFAADGSSAFVVTEDGVSVLDFSAIEREGTGIAKLISLGSDIDQRSLDVSVTPDGRFALARQPGASALRLVDLESGEIQSLDLAELLPDLLPADEAELEDDAGGPDLSMVDVTDLDLAPTGEFALAVLRNQRSVLYVPVPSGFEDDEGIELYTVPGEIVGSAAIAPDGKTALLYTTATDAERITRLELGGDGDRRTIALRKNIQAVAIAPDSETALILHTRDPGDRNEPGIDPDEQIDRSDGYSVLRIGTGDVKLQVTASPARSFTVVPDGTALFVLFRSDNQQIREVQKVDTASFLVTPTRLGSPPISIGSVPSTDRVFVSQEHNDGRITFIDWMNGDTQTVTGFELNSRIRD